MNNHVYQVVNKHVEVFLHWKNMVYYHNDVNKRLGKKIFNCDRYFERWKDGPPDNAKYDCKEKIKNNNTNEDDY